MSSAATSSDAVSARLDQRFGSERGLYGKLEDIPLMWQKGHYRRIELLERIPVGDVSGKVCVDFGTGSWGFAGIYKRLHDCKFAIGLDISRVALEKSRAVSRDGNFPYGQRFDYRQSDGMSLPLEDGSADLIFAGEAIEHVRLPWRFLSECHRALSDGGQLILTTPNRDALLYKTQNDQYCVGPEHFWVLNAPELEAAVSEFFDVQGFWGFNGSLYRDMDKQCRDPLAAEEWARQFENAPHLATGLILHARKRPLALRNPYTPTTLDRNLARITGPYRELDLEFSLTGWMMDSPASDIRFTCPPCAGVVLEFWTHAWSGIASVECGERKFELDLWSQDPGWKPLHIVLNSTSSSEIVVRATGRKRERALNCQVIFFEALIYRQ